MAKLASRVVPQVTHYDICVLFQVSTSAPSAVADMVAKMSCLVVYVGSVHLNILTTASQDSHYGDTLALSYEICSVDHGGSLSACNLNRILTLHRADSYYVGLVHSSIVTTGMAARDSHTSFVWSSRFTRYAKWTMGSCRHALLHSQSTMTPFISGGTFEMICSLPPIAPPQQRNGVVHFSYTARTASTAYCCNCTYNSTNPSKMY